MADDAQNTMSGDSQKMVAIPQEIRSYLEGILADAGMNNLTDAMRGAMVEELYIRLDKFLIGKVVEFLPENKLEEFAKLSETTQDPKAVTEYLQKNLPNAQDVFTQAFGEFREVYLEGAQQVEQNNAQDTQPVANAQ